MQIGNLHKTANGFFGRIHSLTLERVVHLVPVSNKDNAKAPDWRLHLDDDAWPEGIGHEIGAGWTREGGKVSAFIAVQLDCPGLPRSVRANLLPSQRGDDEHVLLWSPRLRAPKAE